MANKYPLLQPISHRIHTLIKNAKLNNINLPNLPTIYPFIQKLPTPKINTQLKNTINKNNPNLTKINTLQYIHQHWPDWCHI